MPSTSILRPSQYSGRSFEDDPRKPPPIVAIVTDQTTGRFRLPPILAVYLELKAREEPD
jgi:hypothetical protein